VNPADRAHPRQAQLMVARTWVRSSPAASMVCCSVPEHFIGDWPRAQSAAPWRSWPPTPLDRDLRLRCPSHRDAHGRVAAIASRCQETGGALVDAKRAAGSGRCGRVVQGECQRRVPRTRAQHHISDAASYQFVNDYARLCRRGVHSYRVSQLSPLYLAKNCRAAA